MTARSVTLPDDVSREAFLLPGRDRFPSSCLFPPRSKRFVLNDKSNFVVRFVLRSSFGGLPPTLNLRRSFVLERFYLVPDDPFLSPFSRPVSAPCGPAYVLLLSVRRLFGSHMERARRLSWLARLSFAVSILLLDRLPFRG